MKNISFLFAKKTIFILIACLSAVLVSAQTQISTYEELQAMGTTGDYELTADIIATGDWVPPVFSGNFDGKGHIISGLKTTTAGTHRVAFISELLNGSIKNLGIEDATFIGQDEVAAIAAYSKGSVIEACYVANSYIEGNDRVGAIVGNLEYASEIKDCYVVATVKSRAWQTGGLVGATWNGDATDNPMTISNSYFAGTVTGTFERNCGIVGLINSTTPPVKIENCVNLASSLKGGNTAYRIVDGNTAANLTLANNYSLSATLCNDLTITTNNPDYGTAKRHGENITDGDAKNATFYTGLGWNFSEKWKLLDDGYPVLQWQKTPIKMSLLNLESSYILRNGDELDLNQIKTLNGTTLTFTCTSNKIAITGNIAKASGIVNTEDITITINVSTDYTIENNIVNIKLMADEGAIKISTPADFALITSNPAKDFELTGDINMADVAFAGLCSPESPFRGTFDGKGYVIKGLNCDNTTISSLGFFRKAVGATIKNLGIEEANLIGLEDVGGIIGWAENTTIEQCYVADSHIESADRTGGIAGKLTEGASVTNCYVANALIVARDHQAGGIVGATDTGGGSIINCYFSGDVKGQFNRNCGILGLINQMAQVNIQNCVNLATELSGGPHTFRIADTNDLEFIYGMDNYSLSTTLCNGEMALESDINYGTDKKHGADIPEGDENARKQEFYESISWDFDKIWTMPENGYPLLRYKETPPPSSVTDAAYHQSGINAYSNNKTVFVVSQSPIKQVWVYDMQGNMVYSDTPTNSFAINFSVDASGGYLVKVAMEQKTDITKVLVK